MFKVNFIHKVKPNRGMVDARQNRQTEKYLPGRRDRVKKRGKSMKTNTLFVPVNI